MNTKKTWIVMWIDDVEHNSWEGDSWEEVMSFVNTVIEDGTPVKVLEQHWQVTSTTPNIWTAPFKEQGE